MNTSQKKNRQRIAFFIIALLVISAASLGVRAGSMQKIFTTVNDVLVCAIERFPRAATQQPTTRCVSNDGNHITIIRKKSPDLIEDTIIAEP